MSMILFQISLVLEGFLLMYTSWFAFWFKYYPLQYTLENRRSLKSTRVFLVKRISVQISRNLQRWLGFTLMDYFSHVWSEVQMFNPTVTLPLLLYAKIGDQFRTLEPFFPFSQPQKQGVSWNWSKFEKNAPIVLQVHPSLPVNTDNC